MISRLTVLQQWHSKAYGLSFERHYSCSEGESARWQHSGYSACFR